MKNQIIAAVVIGLGIVVGCADSESSTPDIDIDETLSPKAATPGGLGTCDGVNNGDVSHVVTPDALYRCTQTGTASYGWLKIQCVKNTGGLVVYANDTPQLWACLRGLWVAI